MSNAASNNPKRKQTKKFFLSFCKENKITVVFVDHRVLAFRLTNAHGREIIVIDKELPLAEWLPMAFELIDGFLAENERADKILNARILTDVLDAEFLT